jgi:DNA-binding NarL/FixJ family response regulator
LNIQNTIYEVLVDVVDNPKELSVLITKVLISKQQIEIYNCLSDEGVSPTYIGDKLNLTSAHVSAQLNHLMKRTNLVSRKQVGIKIYVYFKTVI